MGEAAPESRTAGFPGSASLSVYDGVFAANGEDALMKALVVDDSAGMRAF